jgi:endoribonuclease Dicer
MLQSALIDMVVTEYVFEKFPDATSGQLTWCRSRSVCNPSLALIAVRELALHTVLLHNNPELGSLIAHWLAVFETLSYKDTVLEGWKYDPPKVLSDLTESVMAAVFVDSGYNYVLCKEIIGRIFDNLLNEVSPFLPRDPAAELIMWANKQGCAKIRFM